MSFYLHDVKSEGQSTSTVTKVKVILTPMTSKIKTTLHAVSMLKVLKAKAKVGKSLCGTTKMVWLLPKQVQWSSMPKIPGFQPQVSVIYKHQMSNTGILAGDHSYAVMRASDILLQATKTSARCCIPFKSLQGITFHLNKHVFPFKSFLVSFTKQVQSLTAMVYGFLPIMWFCKIMVLPCS